MEEGSVETTDQEKVYLKKKNLPNTGKVQKKVKTIAQRCDIRFVISGKLNRFMSFDLGFM